MSAVDSRGYYILYDPGAGDILERDINSERMFNLKKAYIIHGYTATPESHWFPWLAEELEKYNYDTEVVDLPDYSEPELKKWRGKIESISPVLNSDTIFIGHSLG